MISVNMKNIAGMSGGGEYKRLKKNCEYILIYAKEYSLLPLFNGPYVYTEISDLVQQYEEEGKSWKYTTVLLDSGEKEYYGSTVDGDGNEIKVFLRKNPIMMSIRQVAENEGITEKDVYKKYGPSIFQTINAQSSIRTRGFGLQSKPRTSFVKVLGSIFIYHRLFTAYLANRKLLWNNLQVPKKEFSRYFNQILKHLPNFHHNTF